MKLADSKEAEDLGELKKVEAAATTIQATFRGYKTRKQYKTNKSPSESNSLAEAAEKQDLLLPEENSGNSSEANNDDAAAVKANDAQAEASSPASDDLNDGELSQEKAVVKIQATYRGFRARKELKSVDAAKTTTTPPPEQPQQGTREDRGSDSFS